MAERTIEQIAPDDLKTWTRNARTHSKKQLRQIADSIERFGFTNPVLIDRENRILAGHGRVAAAKTPDLALPGQRAQASASYLESTAAGPRNPSQTSDEGTFNL